MSEDSLDNIVYDTVILGTGLVESIVASQIAASAASPAKDNADKDSSDRDSTRKVLHIDRNPYYGGTSACFSLSAFIDWAVRHRDSRQTPFVKLVLGSAQTSEHHAQKYESHVFIVGADRSDSPNTDGVGYTSQAQKLLSLIKPFYKPADDDQQQQTVPPCCDKTLEQLLVNDRRYSLELAPKLAFCRGDTIDLLIDEGVGEYVQFRGIEHNYIVRGEQLERVPETKEDVFASTTLGLIEKRKLMRLLSIISDDDQCQRLLEEAGDSEDFTVFLQSRFKLDGRLLDAVLFAVARVGYGQGIGAVEGCERVRKYVKAMGRYGRMAYLCAMYGGASELSQAFCRLCAVSGGTYILDTDAHVHRDDSGLFDVHMPSYGAVKAKSVVMDPAYDPNGVVSGDGAVSRALRILDKPVLGEDTSILLCHVDAASMQTTSMLYLTHATQAVPLGQAVVYAWSDGKLTLEKQEQLQRAMDSVCRDPTAVPLFTAFFEMNQIVCSDPAYIGTSIPDSSVDFDGAVKHALELSKKLEGDLVGL
ncbi:hypothetical protein LPJ56_000947 [Coemansia sp. RSA 2599]|nr:hypothetical protein LPJ75_000261 [Coemansia sp. RSA 2598]KAJ1828684.1 hypothetical protein LPJ56_000947 [Coemansia sp. RSA 2599]